MQRLIFILRTILFGWVLALRRLIEGILEICHRRKRRPDDRSGKASRARCVPIDHPSFVRPDPLIYDQYYLSALGLPVTWDNPDIELRRAGVPVSSSLLEPDTDYEMVARIWNAAPDCPVVHMPVHFSYLDFGIGTVSVPLGATKVNVGVKGSASQPAFASMLWHTPARAGHYCLQVRLDPADDLNYANNLGQENTNVGRAESPAKFEVKLRNNTQREHRYRFGFDAYTLGTPEPCGDEGGTAAARSRRIERHRSADRSLPAGWNVTITPDTASLPPSGELVAVVVVTPPDPWRGTQPINVNAFDENDRLAGGVTLSVVRGS